MLPDITNDRMSEQEGPWVHLMLWPQMSVASELPRELVSNVGPHKFLQPHKLDPHA